MVARVRTVAFHGVEVIGVEAQVTIASGLPAFTVVGLPDKAVAESRERVRAALYALGLALPPRRITVNLAPADVVKEGSHFDLPIALALLAALEALPADELHGYAALGEVALDGSLTPVAGVLLAALWAAGRQSGIICPSGCGGEAAWAGAVEIIAAPSLIAIVNHFKGTQPIPPPEPRLAAAPAGRLDLKDVKGQESAKRALEIAAAGGHNLLMIGPPGAGKSMLAARLPGLLPPLEPEEALELGMIQSIAGGLRGGLSRERPFRDPHHSASLPALVGGGARARPGEISLAHQGVLFLDELPEFSRAALEALRQPLETGRITVARANSHVTYPARIQLVAAMNPCRCGQLAERACGRAPRCAEEYQARLSGPLLDRIDLHIDVPAVSPADLALPPPAEDSAAVARRVAAARARQRRRYRALPAERRVATNAEADGALLDEIAQPEAEARSLLLRAAERLSLSARGYHRVLRVARTLADLEGVPVVARRHIAEAFSYRRPAILSGSGTAPQS
ncbi:MAG TPA: YifB family Mg chelatase-like AAA ATPase [Stellaceae bacterium]|nr:YifB family Mg chelatase-like AAA ATPase [Stellaceae bacterium]